MGKITLRKELKEMLSLVENEYDIVALFYKELLFYYPNAGQQFVTGYIDTLATDTAYAAFAEDFFSLRKEITVLARGIDYIEGEPDCCYGIDTFVQRLQVILESFSLPPQEDGRNDKMSMSIAIFYVLEAIDQYVMGNICTIKNYKLGYEKAPLNKNDKATECYVYLKECSSFLDNAYLIGKRGFRHPLKATRLGDKFTTFQVVDMKNLIEGIGVPRITHISSNRISSCKKIRICSIPYIGFDTFAFHNKNSPVPCKPKEVPKGLFYVDYSVMNEQEEINRIIGLLELAINRRANIIIFPEFIMSKGMLSSIQRYLEERARNKGVLSGDDDLLLVYAGSTVEKSLEEDGWNNILHILSAKGKEIGCYYKYSPYYAEKGIDYHGARKEIKDEQENPIYSDNCEWLAGGGKQCDIIDLDGVGRILPAICRDVIDNVITGNFASIFCPSLIFVPAWSKSITSFNSNLLNYANTLHSASLLCNCCNAISDTSSGIGCFYFPQKKETAMEGSKNVFYPEKMCREACGKKGGCIVQIDIDFSTDMPTSNWRQVLKE